MVETFFTSDTHFHHVRVIEYSKRPFRSIHEMNQTIINRWNERVGAEDEVYHLGDVAFCDNEKFRTIFSQLSGRIHLIRGNHDLKNIKGEKKGYFATIRDYHEINVGGQKIVLLHYPLATWNKSHRGSYSLHGHCHGNPPPGQTKEMRRMDVGVDTNEFYPYHLDEIVKIMEAKPLPEYHHR